MKCWKLEEYAAIDPNLVPKMLPKAAEVFPAYSTLNEAVKELRSAKREFYIGRLSIVVMSVLVLTSFIMGIVSGEMSQSGLLKFAILFVSVFLTIAYIMYAMFVSCKVRIDSARENLEKELSGRNPELFKALFEMINK